MTFPRFLQLLTSSHSSNSWAVIISPLSACCPQAWPRPTLGQPPCRLRIHTCLADPKAWPFFKGSSASSVSFPFSWITAVFSSSHLHRPSQLITLPPVFWRGWKCIVKKCARASPFRIDGSLQPLRVRPLLLALYLGCPCFWPKPAPQPPRALDSAPSQ